MKRVVDKLKNWVHANSYDQSQIENRAMLAAGCPIIIGFLIGLIIIGLLKLLEV